MRLTDLEGQFLKILSPTSYGPVDAMGEADGVLFLCPACFQKNGGPVGTHSMICWGPHVSQAHAPAGGRWPMTGTGLHDLTLTPSVQIVGGCQAHFFVQNGAIVGC